MMLRGHARTVALRAGMIIALTVQEQAKLLKGAPSEK
jgi:hypothetical protein